MYGIEVCDNTFFKKKQNLGVKELQVQKAQNL